MLLVRLYQKEFDEERLTEGLLTQFGVAVPSDINKKEKENAKQKVYSQNKHYYRLPTTHMCQ